MRVSIVQLCSTAIDMLRFSTRSLVGNAGEGFDLVLVTWLASPEVESFILELKASLIRTPTSLTHVVHETDPRVGYVPNLRAMINDGFDAAFRLNEYAGLVNTDMHFGRNWLSNLTKHAAPDRIVNSVHITPISGPHVVSADLGVPEEGKFDEARFEQLYAQLREDWCEPEQTRGGWRATNTCPYLFHRRFWEQCGPWHLTLDGQEDTPDRRFFQRCSSGGATFYMVHDSIAYHHEAVERRRGRPPGAEHLPEE